MSPVFHSGTRGLKLLTMTLLSNLECAAAEVIRIIFYLWFLYTWSIHLPTPFNKKTTIRMFNGIFEFAEANRRVQT